MSLSRDLNHSVQSQPIPYVVIDSGITICLLSSIPVNQFKQTIGLVFLFISAQALAHGDPDATLFVAPYGVDVSSGVETVPGHKDSERIRQFISAVRAAEKNL